MNYMKSKSKIVKIWALLMAFVLIILGACVAYLSDYYHADTDAIAAFTNDNDVKMSVYENGNLIWAPAEATTGFIFYPGGKVEHTAYAPLMSELSSKGILCVLVKMPFNLAVFDINAAEGIQEQFPEIESWYIGGHSLGGSMAASYLSDHTSSFDGLVLLGAYSTEDLSKTNVSVLSIYGSEDTVLNQEKYDECKSNLPSDFQQIIIEGGCHAYFGMYGKQEGDGIPSVTNIEQITFSANAIAALMGE